MKFKGAISKIDEGGVSAKEDNPIKKPEGIWQSVESTSHLHQLHGQYLRELDAWQEAEAQRKEYPLETKQDMFTEKKVIPVDLGYRTSYYPLGFFLEGLRIEGDIINEEIVSVKIV